MEMDMEMDMETDKFQLLDFPDEIFLTIFGFLDDQTLLKLTRVCEKFKNLAVEAVAHKYNGMTAKDYGYDEDQLQNYYKIEQFKGNGQNETKQHTPFLKAFGDKISSLVIEIYYENINYDWIIQLVKQYLHSVTKVELLASYNRHFTDGRNWSVEVDFADFIPCFLKLKSFTVKGLKLKGISWAGLYCPSLVELNLVAIENFTAPQLREFCNKNRQLKHFMCSNVPNLTIDIFDGMKLQTLACENDMDSDETMQFVRETSKVSLCNLVVFSTDNRTKTLFEVLAPSNKNIENIRVYKMVESFKISDQQVDILCSFKKLSILIMDGIVFNDLQVVKLAGELTHLIMLQFVHSSSITLSSIKNILKNTSHSKLSRIRIGFEFTIKEDLPPMTEIHHLFIDFAKPNLVLVLHLTNLVKFQRFKLTCEIFCITKTQVTVATKPEGKNILYDWNDQIHYDPLQKNILQLEENCLKKIIYHLDEGDQLSLYQTCNRMQLLIGSIFQQKYAAKPFHIRRTSSETEDYLRFFGKNISRIFFDIKKCIRGSVTSYWQLIHKFCGNNLMELTLKNSRDISNLSYLSSSGLLFPKLEKLIFKKSSMIIFHGSQLNYSFCPNLVHLEFDENTVINPLVDIYFGTAFDNLTTLRFEWYNTSVLKFIENLNEVVCHNLRELTLRNVRDLIDGYDDNFQFKVDNGIVNAIVRFVNLTKLNLILDGIRQTNVKYLFENCSNLTSLAICHVAEDNWFSGTETWPIIKKSCFKLQKLQLVTRSLEKRLFSTFLKKMFYSFPRITVEILQIGNETSHQVNRYIVNKERIADFDKYPIHTFISGS